MNNKKIKLTCLILFSLAIAFFLQNNVLADSNQQPPVDCVKWYDGCNTCEASNGDILACTEMACQTYNEPKCLVYQDKQPPVDCVKWYDGCNTCEASNGDILACTEKACLEYEEPKCLEYSDLFYVEPDTGTGEPIEVPDQDKPYFCSGCELADNCYPFGYRKSGRFCSDEKLQFVEQKSSDTSCENNFECSSNVCVSGKCVSEGLLQKILNWFKRLFG